jgi:ribosomal protein S12 methylthiotransferase
MDQTRAGNSCCGTRTDSMTVSPPPSVRSSRGRVALVVLGCAKNQVEAESMSSRLAQLGWELTADVPAANVAVIHTCGFLEEARKEALDTVARVRRASPRSFLVMTGCFAQYLGGKNPWGVDALLGTGQFHRLPELLDRRFSSPEPDNAPVAFKSAPSGFHDAATPRPLRPGQLSSYLRISEGCNHRCTFCVIPQLRGSLKSRRPDDIFAEGRNLVDRGVKELVVISQDTTDYGGDLSPRRTVADLAEEICSWEDLRWLRLLYAYPSEVNDRLIRLLAEEPKLCGYVDMPLQHISDTVLKSMARDWGEVKTLRLLDRLKERVPHLALRTTFIVGFPGETDADFRKMIDVVEAGYFEHVGIFPYSFEERSPSSKLGGQVPQSVADDRWKAVTEAQTLVSSRRAKKRTGSTIEVMVESSHEGWVARAPWQAPEVDGRVLLDRMPADAGFYRARITGMKGIDLTAKLLK